VVAEKLITTVSVPRWVTGLHEELVCPCGQLACRRSKSMVKLARSTAAKYSSAAQPSRLAPSRLSASRVAAEDAEAYTFYGHVELGVSQNLHHDPRVYVQIHEEGGAGAPRVVHCDLLNSSRRALCVEVAVEVARLDWVARPGSEH
jgi:hypothetical protein